MGNKTSPVYRVVARNKKAYHDYEMLEKYEAGLSLLGSEVKSLREGKCSIKEAYVRIKNSEAWIIKMHIPPYQKQPYRYDPERPRKLLLHKREIKRLMGLTSQKGIVVIPLEVYFTRSGWAKVMIAAARRKKKYEKREDKMKKDVERRLRKEIKTLVRV